MLAHSILQMRICHQLPVFSEINEKPRQGSHVSESGEEALRLQEAPKPEGPEANGGEPLVKLVVASLQALHIAGHVQLDMACQSCLAR